ncbi:putative membrane protein YabM [Lentibacillus sp. JNUCC-1]|uniref:putative polysaccharide biosynthesis protein n=1 Tax=Lentibacillus sp. JNUCC-1 TaxID=2654513 RepID=UPI0012E894E4|nr:oligosaccharide flippase family protein [Lentibacillus sp. JNUCC-1]MUV38028.1 putative membrane protein YabM [Lentibacillus sp. JNUCC-1]
MKAEQSQGLIKGALLLTVAGFIGKMLSAGYRIPLQNLTGDTGFYIYQQVYPILGVALMLALYGFPSAVSRLTAENDRELGSGSRAFYGRIWLALAILNGLFFIMLYGGAQFLAHMTGDPSLANGYRVTAFVFLLIPFTSLLRGVMQAHGNMVAIAGSQVTEQFARALIITFGAFLITQTSANLYDIVVIGAAAQITGAVLAIIVLVLFWRRDSAVYQTKAVASSLSGFYIFKVIAGFGLLAALNHMTLIVIQAVDMLTLVPHLEDYGLTKQNAMTAKGIIDRGQPLVQLGTVLGSSFALALVPTITKQGLKQEGPIRRALAFSFYLAGGATIGLVLIFPETNTLLYENGEGTGALRILGLALLLSSISITGVSILQSIGLMKWTGLLIVSAGIIKWIGNMAFVPMWGLKGSAAATVVALGLLTAAVLVLLYIKLPGLSYKGVIRWRAFSLAGSGMAGLLLAVKVLLPFSLITSRLVLTLYVTGLVGAGAVVYITILIKLRALDDDDISMLPFASKLMKLRKG